MFALYVLHSSRLDRYYVGHTDDLEDRLARHNQGRSKSTKHGAPWEIVHTEDFETRSQAMAREREVKSWKSAARIRSLVEGIPHGGTGG